MKVLRVVSLQRKGGTKRIDFFVNLLSHDVICQLQ